MSKTQRRRNLSGGKKRRNAKRRNTRKKGGAYDSAWSYVSSVYGDMNTQMANSLTLQPGQDAVSRQSTQSVPIGEPNANVKGMIKFTGGKRRKSSRKMSRRRRKSSRIRRGGSRKRRKTSRRRRRLN